MTIAFFWIGLSLAVGMMAHNRFGRTGLGWFLASLVVSPLLAGAFVLALGPRPDRVVIAADAHRRHIRRSLAGATLLGCLLVAAALVLWVAGESGY